jgi:hypothetical protein
VSFGNLLREKKWSQVGCLPENATDISKIRHYGLLLEQVSLFGTRPVIFVG